MDGSRRSLLATLTLVGSLIGCDWIAQPHDPSARGDLFALPWPDERLRRPDGSIDSAGFPYDRGTQLRGQMLAALEEARGFGLASAIYFPMTDALDASTLPSLEASTGTSASVFVVDVDPRSPEHGRRAPIDVRVIESRPFGAPRLLAALPYPGVPLRPDTLYAAVVTTAVRTSDGTPLAPSERAARIFSGDRIAGLGPEAHQAHVDALSELDALGVPIERIASHTVLRTGDPVRGLRDALAQVLAGPLPVPTRPPGMIEEHANYCVFSSELDMPVFQTGVPPFLGGGGRWAHRADGELQQQGVERARIFFTVPRRDPGALYPGAVFVRTGGGGDRPLIDRGVRDEGGLSVPGTGPAVQLARAGWVGISIDGPLVGSRNLAGWDEQFVVVNALDLLALRDNVRQSALELALLAHVLETIVIDARGCAGAADEVTIDARGLALIGHSLGATIAPLTAAVEPRYRALILSGAGASWVRQVMYKESPVRTRDAAERLLGYRPGEHLLEHDPALAFLEWSGEVADPTAYAHALVDRLDPPHVLVFQGLLDTYIPPPIANPIALSLGLELGGEALDDDHGEHALEPLLALFGRRALALPAGGNGARGETRIVVQHEEDGIEDGHEVLYQRAGAQRQLRCFLESLAAGSAPIVVPPGDPALPCE
jgi:hypothetical protein